MSEQCRIDVQPVRVRADQPLASLKISGLQPGGEVTVGAESRAWEGLADFLGAALLPSKPPARVE